MLTFELNGVAALLPQNRLMGVLPNKDWFERFSYWSDVTGFSLGEFAPRAVIFLPRLEDGTKIGPQITLPAHELGHTFGLSVDSRLKSSWVCDIDWPIVGHAPCGLVGGFDEYQHDDAALQDGNPAERLLGPNGRRTTGAGTAGGHGAMRFALSHGEFARQPAEQLGGARTVDRSR